MLEKLKNLRWLLVSFFIVAVDQMTKLAMASKFAVGELQSVTSFFNLVLVHNEGAAFSFLSDAGGWQRGLFSGISIGVTIGLILWLTFMDAQKRLEAIALTCIMGGAIGNVFDRLTLGYVIDFLDFHLGTWHWPAFNVADMSICLGAFLLFICLWKK
jgi:signal peptidase II